jgi:DNA-binding PadR family transcriptional regulator
VANTTEQAQPLHQARDGSPSDRQRMRRGKVPGLLLTSLLIGPAHGYELMNRLERLTGGSWRPNPGSVYPLLQSFEERGWVEGRETHRRRVFALTQLGREEAEKHRVGDLEKASLLDALHTKLREETKQLRASGQSVSRNGNPQQIEQALAIITSAREALDQLASR